MGIPAAERLLAYELALQTALRASVILALTRSRRKLTGKSPSVVVPSGTTKETCDAVQHITPDLANRLRDHVAEMAPGDRISRFPHLANMADMIRNDMNAARVAWLDTSNDKPAAKKAKKKLLAEHPDFLKVADSNAERIDFRALWHTAGRGLPSLAFPPRQSRVPCDTRTSSELLIPTGTCSDRWKPTPSVSWRR